MTSTADGTTSHDLVIVLPEVSDDLVARNLRTLTRILVTDHHADHVGGGLGGEWGYGTHFANDTFTMHPYYWGDCTCTHEAADTEWWDTHEHADHCYQQVIRARGYLDYDSGTNLGYHARDTHNRAITNVVCAEMGLDPEYGCAVHCTCTHDDDYQTWRAANSHDNTICAMERPNFRHKPTGATVNFYKYLGRGMNVALPSETTWEQVYDDCLRSLTPTG